MNRDEPRRPAHVAVIGAGVTGLATADALLAAGIPVTVYEAGPSTGGLGATFTRDGFSFDHGPHELCTDDERLRAWLAELCGEDLLEVRKRTAQHLNGRLVHFPFRLGDVLRGFGLSTVTRACLDLLLARARVRRRPSAPGSFEEWTTARLGRTLYDVYFEPYTRKVWGVDPAALDASVASERIAAESLWEVVLQSLLRRPPRGPRRPHSAAHRSFLYVRGGIGRLIDRLQARVRDRGGRLATGRRLSDVVVADGAARELVFGDGTRDVGAAHVVSTIGLPDVARLVLDERDARDAGVDELAFRGMVFVHLRIAQPEVTGFQWVYFPDPAVPFQRATEFGQFGAGMCPPDCSALTLEIAADPDDARWEQDDDELVAECAARLVELGAMRAGSLIGGDVVRVRRAYPLHALGFSARVDAVLEKLATVRNLTTIGRQGLFLYCNMDQCIEMGLETAACLAAGGAREAPVFRSRWTGVGLAR